MFQYLTLKEVMGNFHVTAKYSTDVGVLLGFSLPWDSNFIQKEETYKTIMKNGEHARGGAVPWRRSLVRSSCCIAIVLFDVF